MTAAGASDQRGTATGAPVLGVTRVLGAVIVPFLVVAWAILFLVPEDTGRWFAWPVQPPMTAMLLGSIYLGGAWFFVRVVTARAWEEVRLGFLPVIGFATLMGVATAVHWDLFTHGHSAFVAWATLYFSTPVLVLAAWWWNTRVAHRHDGHLGAGFSLTPRTRAVAAALGTFAVAVSLALTVWPELVLRVWPWSLTPLTGRVVGAIFVLGGAGIGIARRSSWRSVRLLIQVAWIMLGLMAVATVRAWDDLDGGPLTGVFVAWIVLVLAGSAVVYVRMERRSRGQGASP